MSENSHLKYLDIKKILEKRIEDGVYPPSMRLPTHVAFSKEFGVSTLTINRVLNELKKDGFIVSRRGSGSYVLAEKNSPLDPEKPVKICILSHRSITQHGMFEYEGRVISGILAGFDLLEKDQKWFSPSETKFTGFKIDSKAKNLIIKAYGESMLTGQRHPPIELIEEEFFDVVITVGIKNIEWLNQLIKINKNVLIVENPEYKFEGKADLIYSDVTTSYFHAIKYLYAKGYQKIHYVGSLISKSAPMGLAGDQLRRFKHENKSLYDPGNFNRLNVYRTAMEGYQLYYDERFMHHSPIIPNEITQELAKHLFELPSDIKPDAVICFNEFQAKKIQKYFIERGELLEAIGATSNKNLNLNFNIYVDPEAIGEATSAIALTRKNSPHSPRFKMGIPSIVIENRNELINH